MTRTALSKLWDDYQGLVALVATFAAGLAVALAMAGWIQLPAKVTAQGDAIVDLRVAQGRQQARMDSLGGDMRRTRCLVEAMALKADPIGRCGL